GDPGLVLLELFAYLTETMIFRLNRLPQKAYLAFLNLLGVSLLPPAAASTRLVFRRERAAEHPIEIPRGTRVTTGRTVGAGEPPVFTTAQTVTMAPGETEVAVMAFHCDLIEGEWIGTGTGLPGLSLTVRHPPIITPTGDNLDLVVGVEARGVELQSQVAGIQYNGKAYRVWREVTSFAEAGPQDPVYIADRTTGTITFAPALRTVSAGVLADAPQALAAVPANGREIRVWYRRGGGPAGNVGANTLVTLKDPIPGLTVTNPSPAGGGQAAESLENALIRGPQELHSLQRAVTARDFEVVAKSSSRAVARSRAFTRAALWRHAVPGTVEVLLVPQVPSEEWVDGRLTAEQLRARAAEEIRSQIKQALDERRPLGTTCVVSWTKYKTVYVTARVVVGREEDPVAVRDRVYARLYQIISPLPTPLSQTGWQYGQALRASDVYNIALAEPGVRWVDRVRLHVTEVPDQGVAALAADHFQNSTWYAGSGATLFRSTNDGEGWESIRAFEGETIVALAPNRDRAGLLAAVSHLPDGGTRLYLSEDAGESWYLLAQLAFRVNDMAWIQRRDLPFLLLATDKGLYELRGERGSAPVQLIVNASNQDLGLYAVAVSVGVRGVTSVAVAAADTEGVYLSRESGVSNSFELAGLKKEDIRRLAVQYDGPRTFLWAGAAAAGGTDTGRGCFRWELRGQDPPDGPRAFNSGWQGGSCLGIGFLGTRVVAASHRQGVLWLTPARDAVWQAPDVRCGLPLRDPGRFHPVHGLATDPRGRMIMAGGDEGVYRSQDGGQSYVSASNRQFSEKVTLPDTWLFVSGDHDVEVVSEDEAVRD
ncbi:MAG: putative baseplate assembly protein, partial [Caldilineaceae bacterium]|nr:putative baseplate assembly protein [Caldilineaceae bacterium]